MVPIPTRAFSLLLIVLALFLATVKAANVTAERLKQPPDSWAGAVVKK